MTYTDVPRFDKGDTVVIDTEVKNLAGELVDPTTLTVLYMDPLGNRYTIPNGDPLIVRDALGKFHFSIQGSISGVWEYKAIPTGAGVQGVDKGAFFIEYSAL